LLVQPNKYDVVDELARQNDDDIGEEGYTIEKDLIVEAWKRFRPVNKAEEAEDD